MAAEADFRLIFEQVPGLFLILGGDAPKFSILGASEAYLQATLTQRDEIVGRGLFEVFPDNPDDPEPTGMSNLRASLERVLASLRPDTMAVQKYDIRRPPSEGGGFEERFWSPMNAPILSNQGELRYLLHQVVDVTEFVRLSRSSREERERSEVLQRRSEVMEAEILRRSQELDAANKELRMANQRAAELDRAKTVFFSNVSHEFRTPLTLLLAPLEDALADREGLAHHQLERLELMRRNALRLLKLVNAILDFSRIEAGRMRASYAATDLARATADLASAFRSAATRAGLQLRVECPPLSEPAYVDREMWEKVVLNLLSNAFKFTFAGEIAVRMRETEATFELAVSDTGAGIPAEELSHIFERFYRIAGAKARTQEGTGIGLSLVYELVKMHGGSVAVRSELDRGTSFVVSIPKGREHLPADAVSQAREAIPDATRTGVFADEAMRWLQPEISPQPVSPAPSQSDHPEIARSARILLVDDTADLRAYMSGLLSPHYRVEVAADGASALEAIRADPPDLVLSDVMMPNLDGFGLLRALRADPRTRMLPVILLSARAGDEAAVEGLDAGADDYLVKPFSARELLARVRTHLGMRQLREAWARQLEQVNEDLVLANRELEAFSASISHDLRAPVRAIQGFLGIVLSGHGDTLEETALHRLKLALSAAQRMNTLIDDLLRLARVGRASLEIERVDLSAIAARVLGECRVQDPNRVVQARIAPELIVQGDPRLLEIALENLLRNAWKFTALREEAEVELGEQPGEERIFFVRDNGTGFDMRYAAKLFQPFQRLHSEAQFEGTGIGLATVQRIIERHHGRIWAEASEGRGATFFFTLSRRVSR